VSVLAKGLLLGPAPGCSQHRRGAHYVGLIFAFGPPIAIGLLAPAGSVPPTALEGLWAIGELGLGGDVRAVKGVLPAALAARRSSARLLVVPQANLVEAALVPDLRVAGAGSLGQVGEWLVGRGGLDRPGPPVDTPAPAVEDLADIRGQHQARRALEIAAAGIGSGGY
jgi:magnesium chelatase family protein